MPHEHAGDERPTSGLPVAIRRGDRAERARRERSLECDVEDARAFADHARECGKDQRRALYEYEDEELRDVRSASVSAAAVARRATYCCVSEREDRQGPRRPSRRLWERRRPLAS